MRKRRGGVERVVERVGDRVATQPVAEAARVLGRAVPGRRRRRTRSPWGGRRPRRTRRRGSGSSAVATLAPSSCDAAVALEAERSRRRGRRTWRRRHSPSSMFTTIGCDGAVARCPPRSRSQGTVSKPLRSTWKRSPWRRGVGPRSAGYGGFSSRRDQLARRAPIVEGDEVVAAGEVPVAALGSWLQLVDAQAEVGGSGVEQAADGRRVVPLVGDGVRGVPAGRRQARRRRRRPRRSRPSAGPAPGRRRPRPGPVRAPRRRGRAGPAPVWRRRRRPRRRARRGAATPGPARGRRTRATRRGGAGRCVARPPASGGRAGACRSGRSARRVAWPASRPRRRRSCPAGRHRDAGEAGEHELGGGHPSRPFVRFAARSPSAATAAGRRRPGSPHRERAHAGLRPRTRPCR